MDGWMDRKICLFPLIAYSELQVGSVLHDTCDWTNYTNILTTHKDIQ